jgi:hypothetical protein
MMGSRAFEGKLAFLSNFTHVPHGIHEYPTVEHFFVAMKTKDKVMRERVKVMLSPGRVKAFGRSLNIREDWMDIRLEVMEYALRLKFKAGTRLAQQLLDIGDMPLVEYNYWHDNYWGECTCAMCDETEQRGQNNLGKLLMKIRSELIAAAQASPPSRDSLYED